MSQQIVSSTLAAQSAVQKVINVDITSLKNQQVTMMSSYGIAGMEQACLVANQLLQTVSDFTIATIEQATVFPAIADKIATIDQTEARNWEEQKWIQRRT